MLLLILLLAGSVLAVFGACVGAALVISAAITAWKG